METHTVKAETAHANFTQKGLLAQPELELETFLLWGDSATMPLKNYITELKQKQILTCYVLSKTKMVIKTDYFSSIKVRKHL